VTLVVVSLALVTWYFRESNGGVLHDVQSAGAAVLKPFEVAAERVARPFRDAAGWVGDVTGAKSENDRLKSENERLRQQVIEQQFQKGDYEQLLRLLRFVDSPRFPKDFRPVATRVIARPPSQYQQQVIVAAGSSDGVRLHAPVVTADGLVGQVTKLTRTASEVTLLSDETSYVSAVDSRTGAAGIVQLTQRATDSLEFARVTKDRVVEIGDAVVTAGWQSKQFASIYPRGIPIGVVTGVSQVDTDLFKRVQIRSFVDFASLDAVLVLVAKKPQPVVPR
jgi:rod shape-determining protein MreC